MPRRFCMACERLLSSARCHAQVKLPRLQVLELLAGHIAQWACSVAYPELAHVPALQLRRFVKKTTVARFSAAAKGLLAAMEANAAFVEERRRSVDFAPKDTGLVQAFLSQEDAAQQVCTPMGLLCVQTIAWARACLDGVYQPFAAPMPCSRAPCSPIRCRRLYRHMRSCCTSARGSSGRSWVPRRLRLELLMMMKKQRGARRTTEGQRIRWTCCSR